MDYDQTIGVVGASARAAVHSLLRAGFKAWAVDLFGDRDLAMVAPCAVCPLEDYPEALPKLAKQFPPGPVMYTGGLENYPHIVAELAESRELWGQPADVLRVARNPFLIRRALEPRGMNLGFPSVHPLDAPLPKADHQPEYRWLLKPRSGSGGHGIRHWTPGDPLPASPERWYFQEFIDGVPMSAVFFSDETRTVLLGVTEQLVGESWLHAPPFGYAGNIGPIEMNPTFWYIVHRSGETIATASGLRGIWGFDFIHDPDNATYPVELNPRYTASIEVLEHGARCSAASSHVACFTEEQALWKMKTPKRFDSPVGKAIYYAPRSLVFPAVGPWDADLATPFDPRRLPAFADIPAAGSVIPAGQPVITLFVSGSSPTECRDRLKSRAAELDLLLAERSP